MTTPSPTGAPNGLVISYLGLRKAVGTIGITLPFVLALGKILLEGPGLQPTISHYYYSVMRGVFVGSLCAIGVFLLSYRGYERKDDIAGDLACVLAVGTALFPVAPDDPTPLAHTIGIVHLLCAAALFLTLAYFCVLFRKFDPTKGMTPRKRQRNRVYAACGITIVLCVALIAVCDHVLPDTFVARLRPVFWLEAAAIFAFGVSWFTKGEAILKDE